ncbi:MAG TPA: hypothetical protein VFY29_15750 [Terriglobia bacterium]|nr:hypothetical protein [Terriglobia bacterium]
MLKRLFVDNWSLKLLALALSTALWLAVTGDEVIIDKGIDAPLEFIHAPAGAGIESRDGRTVAVYLRGPSTLMREISVRDVSVLVDAGSLRYGDNTVALTFRDVRHPYGVEVVQILPDQIRVDLQRRVDP